ncbi:MAG: RsmF rRNA methyltransferase first C-terminal domain-containing protein, partial [Clostridia bacterium]|nr:RsmF rRNA methyltransferase first C-terminal domain-containing protein [Clostridia bacterium]
RRRDAPAPRADRDAAALLTALEREVCMPPDFVRDMRLLQLGDRLYCRPGACPNTDGLRVVQPGLCLLRAGRNHIEPAHALAMALPPERAHRRVELDEDQARAWLRGEALPLDGEKGWALVTHRGLPLGWGKRADGTLKNHLPKGLRRHT